MKNRLVALGLCIFGSVLGLHHYYLENYKKGVLFTFTAGGFGIWWIRDIIMIITDENYIQNYEIEKYNSKNLDKLEKARKKEEFNRIMESKPTVSANRSQFVASRPQVGCPRCGSTQITANKKGFSLGKALVGSAVILPLGAVTGMMGKNKILITCLSCGKQFKPGR